MTLSLVHAADATAAAGEGRGEASARLRTSRGKGSAKSRCRGDRRGDTRDVHILVVEDEDAIAEPLVDGLRREGYDVARVATGDGALEARRPDLVLLDLRLPDIDGLDVCRQLRERSRVPIIVVTARGEEADRVVGLELGADDYVVKPFGLRELIARIRAVTRRAASLAAPTAARCASAASRSTSARGARPSTAASSS